MPGPVSDAYHPEFSTCANAQDVCDEITRVRGRITELLGPELHNIVDIVHQPSRYTQPHDVRLSEQELRVIRFCLDRAMETI